MQEYRCGACTGEGRGYLTRDDASFAHTGHHDLTLAIEQKLKGFVHLLRIKLPGDAKDSLSLFVQFFL